MLEATSDFQFFTHPQRGAAVGKQEFAHADVGFTNIVVREVPCIFENKQFS